MSKSEPQRFKALCKCCMKRFKVHEEEGAPFENQKVPCPECGQVNWLVFRPPPPKVKAKNYWEA